MEHDEATAALRIAAVAVSMVERRSGPVADGSGCAERPGGDHPVQRIADLVLISWSPSPKLPAGTIRQSSRTVLARCRHRSPPTPITWVPAGQAATADLAIGRVEGTVDHDLHQPAQRGGRADRHRRTGRQGDRAGDPARLDASRTPG